jgi:hypothetical protein
MTKSASLSVYETEVFRVLNDSKIPVVALQSLIFGYIPASDNPVYFPFWPKGIDFPLKELSLESYPRGKGKKRMVFGQIKDLFLLENGKLLLKARSGGFDLQFIIGQTAYEHKTWSGRYDISVLPRISHSDYKIEDHPTRWRRIKSPCIGGRPLVGEPIKQSLFYGQMYGVEMEPLPRYAEPEVNIPEESEESEELEPVFSDPNAFNRMLASAFGVDFDDVSPRAKPPKRRKKSDSDDSEFVESDPEDLPEIPKRKVKPSAKKKKRKVVLSEDEF